MPYIENYNTDLVNALPGMIADTSLATIVSRTVEDDPIPFGVAVVQGAGDHGVTEVASGDTALYGISVRDQAVDAESTDEYPVGDTLPVLLTGAIWVTAGGTVNAGDPVGVVVATGAFVTGSGVTLTGAKYETSGDAADLVRVRIA